MMGKKKSSRASDVSQNTLAVFVVLAVMLSIATTWIMLSKVSIVPAGGGDNVEFSAPNKVKGHVELVVSPLSRATGYVALDVVGPEPGPIGGN